MRIIPTYQQLIGSEPPEVEDNEEKSQQQDSLRGELKTVNDIRTYTTAGNATITIKSKKTTQRFTFKIKKPATPKGKVKYFVSLLNGPINTKDYVYLGHINDQNQTLVYCHGKKSKITELANSAIAFRWFWEKLIRDNSQALSQIEVWHEGTCCRCGRTLTVLESVRNGIGPECSKKMLG